MMLYGVLQDIASKMLRSGELTVSVYGLGKMGLPLALVFADNGANVIGVDVDPGRVELVNRGVNPIPNEPGITKILGKALKENRFRATTNGAYAARSSDLNIVIVPVKADEKGIDMSSMDNAMRMIGMGLRKGSIIVTETTLPPGTTESYIPLLEELSGLKAGRDFGIAHAPERTMSGRVIKDITESYPKVIGALDKKTLDPLIGIYSTINKKGVVSVSSIRIAEAVKVFEGVYRDVNIALANELALISEELGIDVIEAIKAANTQPYSHIHKPGAGVGGHCIGVYTWFLIHRTPELARMLRLSRTINNYMPHHMVELLVKALNKNKRSLKDSRIIVLGLSYRGGVKETINSPSIPLIKELVDWEANVEVYDPLYTREEIEAMGFKAFNNDYRNADALVLVTNHKEYHKIDLEDVFKQMRTPVLVDGRYVFLDAKGVEKYYYAAPGLGLREPLTR